ncbi:MAG: prepilin-type N-terminal cleavage/methylation domain-containing protein [Minisyncoccia bacterium]
MIKILKQKNKGFTLVETLVAISIFTMSVLALMVILGQGVSDTGYAKKKMTATYLAQEGIEYIRNIRDTSALSSTLLSAGWSDFKNNLISSCSVSCYFDSEISNSVISCGNNSCQHLFYNYGKYNYDSIGDDSGFVRSVRVDSVSEDEIKINSTVFWTQGSGTYSVSFSESLFNWIQ